MMEGQCGFGDICGGRGMWVGYKCKINWFGVPQLSSSKQVGLKTGGGQNTGRDVSIIKDHKDKAGVKNTRTN